jgi:DNA-binding CsgD family transcriptional regulator
MASRRLEFRDLPMNAITLKKYSEALEKIYTPAGLVDYPGRVFEVLEALIPNVVISLDEFDLITKAARESINRRPPNPAAWIARLKELVPLEHPGFPLIMSGYRGMIQVNDHLSERQLKRTGLYNDVFKPMGVRHQVVLPLRVPNHVAGITISRDKEFSEVELTLAGLLSPHIALAHVTSQNVTALRILRECPVPTVTELIAIGLTPREAEVTQWVIEGKRDGEIGSILGISPRSVNKHLQQILQKLKVETRTAAAIEAMRRSRVQSIPPV